MTRSFGDRVAAMVGVIDEPEILTYDIRPDDRCEPPLHQGLRSA